MFDVWFWLPIALIIVIGTVGGLLFKYGTNAFGSISLERMFDIQFSSSTFLYLGMMLVGVLLIVFSGYSLRGEFFAMRFLFSPLIFCALVALFISRLFICLAGVWLGKIDHDSDDAQVDDDARPPQRM